MSRIELEVPAPLLDSAVRRHLLVRCSDRWAGRLAEQLQLLFELRYAGLQLEDDFNQLRLRKLL